MIFLLGPTRKATLLGRKPREDGHGLSRCCISRGGGGGGGGGGSRGICSSSGDGGGGRRVFVWRLSATIGHDGWLDRLYGRVLWFMNP